MGLKKYIAKRHFNDTPEPTGSRKSSTRKGTRGKQPALRFVVQEHHATRLHFDFRLEMEGVLKSWAVPKGPTLDPSIRRLAMMVEDHPVDYQYFSGKIPDGNYGAGEVRIWDHGTYEIIGEGTGIEQIKAGKVTIIMHGKILKGEFHLIHTPRDGAENSWLLFKHQDEFAKPGWELEQQLAYGSNKEKRELAEQGIDATKLKATRMRTSSKTRKPIAKQSALEQLAKPKRAKRLVATKRPAAAKRKTSR